MMPVKEALSGAPIFRGRWAAVFFIWLSGELAGDMDFGLVWVFVPDSVANSPGFRHHWSIDIIMLVGSMVSLFLGLLCLDQYGRNSWFAWAPDDVKWSGFTRSDVNRAPWPLPAKVYQWWHRVVHRNPHIGKVDHGPQ